MIARPAVETLVAPVLVAAGILAGPASSSCQCLSETATSTVERLDLLVAVSDTPSVLWQNHLAAQH